MPGKIIFGLLLIGFGTLLTLGNLDIVNFSFGDIFKYLWPTLFIFWGLQSFAHNRSKIWAIGLLSIGIFWFLDIFDVISVNLWSIILPILLIGTGLSIMLPKHFKQDHKGSKETNKGDTINRSAIFSGFEVRSGSEDFRGGEITTIFGGADIDLRDAKIKKKAVIDVNAVFGGVEIKVAEDCLVELAGTPIFGGFEDKTSKKNKTGGVLQINGTVVFGGIEIKN